MKHLNNKRVLITGAGHGLGRELAKSFGRAGCEVIVTDRDPERVAETANALQKANVRAFGYSMDVTNSSDVLDVHDHVLSEHGPIDLLVNNAGIVCGGTFENVPLERHATVYQVNSFGPVVVTHTFLPGLIARPQAHIVNIASASALMPLPFATTYAASKWAVLGFSESLREELRLTGHDHVQMTSVCPGYIATGMFTGVKTPFLMPMLTPQVLADRVVDAVRCDCEILRTPWQVKLLPMITALLPRRLQRWLGGKLGVLDGMQNWNGYAHPATLAKEPFAPQPSDTASRVLSK
jgi:all-trans-retinol dehydrogenase (NAD+)